MTVFGGSTGRLDIINVAGTPVAEGTEDSVLVVLPPGSSPNQTITVQARDFTGMVPIQVALTPENGPRTTFDSTINMTANPASVVVPVTVPVNQPVTVNAWTR